MNRVVGIETEYGCLIGEDAEGTVPWPVRVKNHAFHCAKLGALDLHYRDYEEPPGNGGFLLNGGRLYVDMGHLEYSSPECRSLFDLVSYDLAGDLLVQSVLEELQAADQVSFLKNNIDHHTGVTFGCHENYLMQRQLQFDPQNLGTLLAFLATRQLFTGAGRVGQANLPPAQQIHFQLSQRADHIVNDLFQWVQFNRAIIHARDEPLADPRKFRRLHLLIGDSNVSPYATALKIGTTALVLSLLERGLLPPDVILQDAVAANRQVSHHEAGRACLTLLDGRSRDALDIQDQFLHHASSHLAGLDPETDWILQQWAFTLHCLRRQPHRLIGAVDWLSKKWLLDLFRQAQPLNWHDPWIQSLDLEYHNLNPAKGLFFALEPNTRTVAEFNARVRRPEALLLAPSDTRACGRGAAVSFLLNHPLPYVINWDSLSIENTRLLPMPNPFDTYLLPVQAFTQSFS